MLLAVWCSLHERYLEFVSGGEDMDVQVYNP